jgi:hypothetical protein
MSKIDPPAHPKLHLNTFLTFFWHFWQNWTFWDFHHFTHNGPSGGIWHPDISVTGLTTTRQVPIFKIRGGSPLLIDHQRGGDPP